MKTHQLFIILCLCFLLGSTGSSASAALPATPMKALSVVATFETGKTPTNIIHIATTGNDTTGNGSAGAPYRTLQKGASMATPGTAVRIHAGTYSGWQGVTDLSGTAAAPIWIGGAPGEAKPLFTNSNEVLHFTRVRYLIIHDLEVANVSNDGQNGINMDDGGAYSDPTATQHIVFRNLFVHNIGTGNSDCLKLSGVDDYYIFDSEFAYCGGVEGSGVDHVGCHDGMIFNNYFHDIAAGNAIQTKGGSKDIDIYANRFVNCGERALNIGGWTSDSVFRPPIDATHNYEAKHIRITANLFEGSNTPFAFVSAVENYAINNTIINPTHYLFRILQEKTTGAGITFVQCGENVVANNIFYFNHSLLSQDINIGGNTRPATFVLYNNLWYAHNNASQSKPDQINGTTMSESNGYYGSNPLFINPASGNWHLQASSPAISAGVLSPIAQYDYEGRLYITPPSLGAFEYWVLNFIPLLVR